MSVLLVNPPGLSEPSGQTRTGESFIAGQKRRLRPEQYYSLPFEHLGILSIAASARARGIEVEAIDGLAAGHASVEETMEAIRAAARRSGPPALIGFSTIDTFGEVVWLAGQCRREWGDVEIALGNTFASLNVERILQTHDCFDFLVTGEGEVAFPLLARAILDGGPVGDIPGLARRGDDGAIRSAPPTAVDLDQLPWAARDHLPAVLAAGFAASIFTSRGCPYRCTFCGTGAMSGLLGGRKGYRLRSIDDVVDELEYLVRDFGIDFVSITDDLFLGKMPASQERAARLASEILRRGLRVAFMLDARLDAIQDLDLLAHLKRAGLRRLFIGVETGSYQQLTIYKKRHIADGADPAAPINAVQALGIEVVPGTIMFHPTVTPRELRETLRVLKATGYKTPGKLTDRITAYAGTPLYREYAAKGYLTRDWPVGEWAFQDPGADRTYQRLVERISGDVAPSFEEAEELFLTEVAAWEAAAGATGQEHRPWTSPSIASGA